ncbi:MAG: dihydropteroate synthase, partial [Halobacteriaceae archaeon]
MEYQEAINYIFKLRRFRPQPGTQSTADLLEKLGNPHKNLTYVQIAGSNGKGSTSRMLEQICRAHGLDTGLYTSPHLDDVRERIRINGRKIPESTITDFVEQLKTSINSRAANNDAPTFFETITALALYHFGSENIDIAILEVGIGGKYDATSVIDPVASCVTSVALEHTSIIGETIEEIARDKAHVAPDNQPLVTATTGSARETVREQAGDILTVGESKQDDITVLYKGRTNHTEAAIELDGQSWSVSTSIPLLGEHQARNAGIAAAIARQIGDLSSDTIAQGLRNATWPGRFEVMKTNPLTVLDGAHNPDACDKLVQTLDEFEFNDLILVFGAMHDKDIDRMANILSIADHVILCEPDVERSADRDVMQIAFESYDSITSTISNVERAVAMAFEESDKSDCVLITGSLSTVGEARRHWTRTEVPKQVDSLSDARKALKGADVTEDGIWRMRGKGVHRVIKTRVRPRQSQFLKEEMLSLGGECAISGVRDPREYHDIVLMGTLAQFKRLCEKLQGQPYGLPVIGKEIRTQLGIQTSPEPANFPWQEDIALMGVLNVTPDSFHDGGKYNDTENAIERAKSLANAGADIIDIGGESTRPGADPVPSDVERNRIIPVIKELTDLNVFLSVDTRRADVAQAALEAGANIINDVSGLSDPEMRFVAAEYDVPLIIMHSINIPVDPTETIVYDDVVEDIIEELNETVLSAKKAGVDPSKIIVDPGLGFGKTAEENFEILDRINEFS